MVSSLKLFVAFAVLISGVVKGADQFANTAHGALYGAISVGDVVVS